MGVKRLLLPILAACVAGSPEAALAQAESQPVLPEPASASGAFWSLAYPGGGQFYLGDTLRGTVYLGVGFGAAIGTFSFLRSQKAGNFVSQEEIAFMGVLSLIPYLAVGTVSLFDALSEISSRTSAAPRTEDQPAPQPGATPKPRRIRGED